MTLTPSLPTASPAGLPLLAERRIWAGAVARAADGTPRTGVLPAHFDPLVTGKASMGYNIAEFVAVTSRQSPGVEFVANDGTADLSPTGYAAPTANSRLDVIWVRSRFTSFGDSTDAPEFGITQGAASPTPTKPSLPAGALELAVAEVKATDTTTQTVVITQTHPYTAMAGGVVPLRNAAEAAAWSPPNGAQGFRVDLGVPVTRFGGSWSSVPPLFSGRMRRSDGALVINGGAALTGLKWQGVDTNTLNGATGADSNGAYVTVPDPGVYEVSFSLPVDTTGFTVAAINGGVLLAGILADEINIGSGFARLKMSARLYLTANERLWVSIRSNTGGTMRADGVFTLSRA